MLPKPPPLFTDTSPEMLDRYVEHLRGLTVEQRCLMFERLVRDGREMARMGLRARHPQASPQEVEIRLAALLYGREAASILGPVPDDAVVPLPPLARPDVRLS